MQCLLLDHRCLHNSEKMNATNYAKAHIELMSKSKDVLEETETVVNEMRSFVQRESFPAKLQIEEEVMDSQNPLNYLFNYAMLVKLWNACKIPTLTKMFIAIREIGEAAISQEEMSFNVTLMHVILTNGDFFESDCGRNNLPYPAVRYFRGIISSLWEGIRGWEN